MVLAMALLNFKEKGMSVTIGRTLSNGSIGCRDCGCINRSVANFCANCGVELGKPLEVRHARMFYKCWACGNPFSTPIYFSVRRIRGCTECFAPYP